MAWYTFWKKKVVELPQVEEPSKEVPLVVPEPIVLVPKKVFKSDWRNGMWVMTSKGIGVIFKLDHFNEVHLVNDKGETIGVTLELRQAMRQATFKEIPVPRKIGLTAERAAELGYM